MPPLAYLLARFSEPSSYAGLGAILALLGLHLSDTLVGQLAQALAAGCGLAALALKEKGLVKALAPVAIVALGLPLLACTAEQKLQTVGDAQDAVAKTADAVSAVGGSGNWLTKAQAAACAAQALTNTMTDMLRNTGHDGAANNAARVSAQIGVACTWAPVAVK